MSARGTDGEAERSERCGRIQKRSGNGNRATKMWELDAKRPRACKTRRMGQNVLFDFMVASVDGFCDLYIPELNTLSLYLCLSFRNSFVKARRRIACSSATNLLTDKTSLFIGLLVKCIRKFSGGFHEIVICHMHIPFWTHCPNNEHVYSIQ